MVTGSQLTSKEVKLSPLRSKAVMMLLSALDKNQFGIRRRITVYNHKVYNIIIIIITCKYKRREFSDSGKELYKLS